MCSTGPRGAPWQPRPAFSMGSSRRRGAAPPRRQPPRAAGRATRRSPGGRRSAGFRCQPGRRMRAARGAWRRPRLPQLRPAPRAAAALRSAASAASGLSPDATAAGEAGRGRGWRDPTGRGLRGGKRPYGRGTGAGPGGDFPLTCPGLSCAPASSSYSPSSSSKSPALPFSFNSFSSFQTSFLYPIPSWTLWPRVCRPFTLKYWMTRRHNGATLPMYSVFKCFPSVSLWLRSMSLFFFLFNYCL